MSDYAENTPPELDEVFNAMDPEGKGRIPVAHFLATFSTYMSNSTSPQSRRLSVIPEIGNVIKQLDPEHTGFISIEDFKKYFENAPENSNGVQHSSPPTSLFNNSKSTWYGDNETSPLVDKPYDSGFMTHDTSLMDDNESSISLDGIHRTGPNAQRSPWSGSRSDIMVSDALEANLGLLHEEVRNIKEQVKSMSPKNGDAELSRRLDSVREENARLTAQLTVLEERLKESEARSQRNVDSERTHWQAIMSRTSADHTHEVESLRLRISNLDHECSTLRQQVGQYELNSKAAVVDMRRHNTALEDAEEQVYSLKAQLQIVTEKHKVESETVKRERDNALETMKAVHASPDGFSSGGISQLDVRYQEASDMVRRLTAENRQLKLRLEELQDEMLAMTMNQGKSLLKPDETSWAAESDNYTKEQVLKLLTEEKHYNHQLLDYLNSLISNIIERHPSLLDITHGGGGDGGESPPSFPSPAAGDMSPTSAAAASVATLQSEESAKQAKEESESISRAGGE